MTQAFEVETEKESSGEESDGGGTELDYGDKRRLLYSLRMRQLTRLLMMTLAKLGIVLQPPRLQILVASMMMKSPIPRKPQMKASMTRNQLVLKMALYHMTQRFWLLGELPKAPWITSPSKLFKES